MASIRRATSDDVAALLPLVAEYWAFEAIAGFRRRSVESAIAQLVSTPGLGAGWIAFDGAVPVGYLLAVYVFSLEHGGVTAEIDELFVAAGSRRAGVGSALLDAAEREFVRSGCTNVSLQVSRSNVVARDLYRRRGYGERSRYDLLEKSLILAPASPAAEPDRKGVT